MSDEIKFTFSCKSCGVDPATLELPDDYTDDDIAKCKACGTEFGRYGDIKAKMMDMAREEISAKFRDAFKGLKGWDVK
ncbi:hypothetical protein EPIB1_1150 [Tritonibacter mobilis]|uniref:hypothetical protein n=1 Tax=Tritonibacter mobilis TaxID=379347 RepID=UPI000F6C6172|nr:hypothetical protein [Tritonibacter mobilis]VCU58252.1 hypothetical protein EPIB1_1150 [Tritonibacter mobilis]